MKNKKMKIISSIILMLIILIISSKAMATITINGSNYYAKEDISWSGSIITVTGGNHPGTYYCANHGRSLGTEMISSYTPISTSASTGWVSVQGITDKTNLSSKRANTVTVKKDDLKEVINQNLAAGNRTATVSEGVTTKARDPLEAAIYAFACTEEFGLSTEHIRDAIWNYGNLIGESNAAEETNPILWNAALGYVDWAGYDPVDKDSKYKYEENQGTFETGNNQPNLVSDASEAKVNFDYGISSYVVGPFTISYDPGYEDEYIKFTKDFNVKVVKQDGIEITSFKILNAEKAVVEKVPNGDNFYVEFPYEGNEDIEYIKLLASVKYISLVHGESTKYDTQIQTWQYRFGDASSSTITTYNHTRDDCPKKGTTETVSGWTTNDYNCITGWYINVALSGELEHTATLTEVMQDFKQIDGYIQWKTAETEVEVKFDEEIMEIAGYVWEDGEEGKSQEINGKKDNNETPFVGIEVRLYEYNQNTGVATLATVKGNNPTLTDDNGYYSFKGVDPTNKYYVMFTYDGMIYTNTYGAGKPEYNTPDWNASSKGSELVNDRAIFNEKFLTIGSYPKAYRVPVQIFSTDYLTDGYNEVFDKDDERVKNYKDKITQQLGEYLKQHNKLEEQDYIKQIYEPILQQISDNNEKIIAKKILQYIWDCRINSYAGHESVKNGQEAINGLYPYKNKIVLTNNLGEKVVANEEKIINGYYVVYNGQLHVNQGLIKRNSTNLELTEDLSKTIVSINKKDETYNYGALSKKELGLISSDVQTYIQNIANSDYNYVTADSGWNSVAQYPIESAPEPIQVYLTYKIMIKNASNIPTSVDELVTYFDTKYYSYSDTYTTTQGVTFDAVQVAYIENGVENELDVGINTSVGSRYGASSETGEELGTDLYIYLDRDIILENETTLAVYVTYRLGGNSEKDRKYHCTYRSDRGNTASAILQDALIDDEAQLSVGAMSEINGFKTFYAKDADDENTIKKYSNYYKNINGKQYRAAGVLDFNSIPGNLNTTEIRNAEENYGKASNNRIEIEDDWDDASTLIFKRTGNRALIGNVWETVNQPANVWQSNENYPTYNDSYKVKDITVQLIELKDGKQYIRALTSTDVNGQYQFSGYVPGDYTVRFVYGDKVNYNSNPMVQVSPYTTFSINGQDINCAYNGQFYQSAKANPNTNNTQFWYAGEEADTRRYSDAYDETSIRMSVNNSLTQYTYKDVVDIIEHPGKQMAYAYTSVLDIYPEYAKKETVEQNPGYTISHIDFALTPRTVSDLRIEKKVSHIKLILQNGNVQFDADTSTIREQGVPGVVQAAEGNNINISMSSELVNGATLEITYTITVINQSPRETITYYKDASGNVIAMGLYNEEAGNLVYYEGDIRIYRNEPFTIQADGTYASLINAGTTQLIPLDSTKTEVIETEASALAIADFVPNNLNFIKTDYTGKTVNEYWNLYNSAVNSAIWENLNGTKVDLDNKFYKHNTDNAIANMNAEEVYNSNEIVLTSEDNPLVTTKLKSGEEVSADIVLSKIISVNDESTDKKSYQNSVRILKIFNSNSRIQDMVGAESEKVIIADPTGIGNGYLVLLVVLLSILVIAIGVVLIKKFAIVKKV